MYHEHVKAQKREPVHYAEGQFYSTIDPFAMQYISYLYLSILSIPIPIQIQLRKQACKPTHLYCLQFHHTVFIFPSALFHLMSGNPISAPFLFSITLVTGSARDDLSRNMTLVSC